MTSDLYSALSWTEEICKRKRVANTTREIIAQRQLTQIDRRENFVSATCPTCMRGHDIVSNRLLSIDYNQF